MNITATTTALQDAPEGYVRVRFVEEKKVKRLVREGDTTYLELSIRPVNEMTRRRFVRFSRSIITAAKSLTVKKLAVEFTALPELPLIEIVRISAVNFEMANYEFVQFKTQPNEESSFIEDVILCSISDADAESVLARSQKIGQGVNACRALANMPGGSLTPRGLAQAAAAAVEGLDVTVETIGLAEIEKQGMGLLAGVGRGSANEPTFTVMKYKGAEGAPIVLIGKGITFDSGGLNIKSSAHIYEMHMDMSGAAAVIHAVALAAKLGVKKHVIGLIPAAENMPGQNAVRPGDILTSLSGKTVEVSDTDAEGRLVLADAITYAKQFKPSVVLDAATLTGAALSALGLYASGLMTRDDAVAQQLLDLGEVSGDYLWRLPLWEEYEGVVKSDFADLVNYPLSKSLAYGGATGGGIFLLEFAKELDCPWAHLDIAPRMTSAAGDELAKGAAGEPVRLLLSFIESWKA